MGCLAQAEIDALQQRIADLAARIAAFQQIVQEQRTPRCSVAALCS
jgi:hypothetical protein